MTIPRGLVRVNPRELPLLARQQLKEQLTIYPQKTSSFTEGLPEPIRVWDEDQECLGVPRGYFNCYLKKRFGCEGVFQYSNGRNQMRQVDPITPRAGQGEVIDRAIAVINSNEFGGAIIEAQTAAGKTVLGLEVARRLGLKTLVVVHTTVLLEQWIKEINKFFPTWKVGIVQADKVDTNDKDICVGIINSLSMKEDYPSWLYDEFGFMVFDEVHLMASKEFNKVFSKFRPRYMLGLSGTLSRADRAENVFKFGIGTVIKAMGDIQSLNPKIYFVDTKYTCNVKLSGSTDRQKIQFLQNVIYDDARNLILVQNAVKAALTGRHVLILSERVNHVEILYRQLVKELIPRNITVGMLIGEMCQAMREKHQTSQVLVATNKLLGTGFNNPRMDTLIFATPIQAVEQPAGRIRRMHPDKKDPIIVDPFDSCCSLSVKLAKSRWKRYRFKNWATFGDALLKIR